MEPYEYDWPEGTTHVLIPSINWQGGEAYEGKHEYATLIDGKYYSEEGDIFCVHANSWKVIATRPEAQIEQSCGNLCNRVLLEKELKIQGAKEFCTYIDKHQYRHLTSAARYLQDYINYVKYAE